MRDPQIAFGGCVATYIGNGEGVNSNQAPPSPNMGW